MKLAITELPKTMLAGADLEKKPAGPFEEPAVCVHHWAVAAVRCGLRFLLWFFANWQTLSILKEK